MILLIRSPFSILFKGVRSNFKWLGKDTGEWIVFDLDIPSLTQNGTQLSSAFRDVKELNSSSMIEMLIHLINSFNRRTSYQIFEYHTRAIMLNIKIAVVHVLMNSLFCIKSHFIVIISGVFQAIGIN